MFVCLWCVRVGFVFLMVCESGFVRMRVCLIEREREREREIEGEAAAGTARVS